jgi:LmbE family N-acetylglucosaminyl deacetylase
LDTVLAAGRLVPNILCYEQVPVPRVSKISPAINYYVDISDYWEVKKAACNEHVSQTTKFKTRQGVDIVEQLMYLARYRGGQSGCKYAEGFHILKMVK